MGSIPWGGPHGDPMAQSLVGKPWDLYYGIPMGFFCKGEHGSAQLEKITRLTQVIPASLLPPSDVDNWHSIQATHNSSAVN